MVGEDQLDVEEDLVYAALLISTTWNSKWKNKSVTEQGEVIQQKYGSESLAEYTLRNLYWLCFKSDLCTPPTKPKKQLAKING